MLSALIVLACAALNRMRGDDRWMPSWLPGRALFYVAPLIGLVAWDWRFALAYFVWGLGPWGAWFDLGRLPKDFNRVGVKQAVFEKVVQKISFGSDHLALFWRHAVAVPLLWWLVGPVSLAFPPAVVAAYEIAWRVRPSNPIIVAELITGAIWGLYVVAL